MSTALAGDGQVIDWHLDPNDVVAYIERSATAERRVRIESHLAQCGECREEVSEAARLLESLRVRGSWRRGGLAVAAIAAAIVFIAVWPHPSREPPVPQHREAAVTTTIAPVILSPSGSRRSLGEFAWTSVPHADGYDVRVFDASGSVVWHKQTTDTLVRVPADLPLVAGQRYYWRVQARVDVGRYATSDLIEFSIQRPDRR